MSEVQGQYIPPPVPPPPPPPTARPPYTPPPQFDFGRPFAFIFDDPQWLQKILIGGLFYLAGFVIIGWFFILGYAARVARNVIRGADVPLPEWDDLGGYFSEGARLIGVGLIYMLPLFVIFGMFIVPLIFAGIIDDMSDGGSDVAEGLASGFAGCMACLIVPLILLVIIFMPASLLFAAVEQRFGAAFEFGRIFAFIQHNLGNYLLAIVIYLIAGFIGRMGGALLCIGVIFTSFWAFMITTHAFAQVYRLGNPAK